MAYIFANSQLPSDFIDLARTIANNHFNATSVSCQQGCFSLTYVAELEAWRPVSCHRPVSGHSSGLVPLCDSTPYVFLRRHALVPLSVSADKLGTLVPTIEETSTDVSVSAHVYIMNYIHGSMWNSALGLWEEDVAIAGQLGEALSRCIVGPDSSEIVESYIIPRLQPYYAKTFHQTDLNYVEALKNSSWLLLISRNSLFLFPMWISMRRTWVDLHELVTTAWT